MLFSDQLVPVRSHLMVAAIARCCGMRFHRDNGRQKRTEEDC